MRQSEAKNIALIMAIDVLQSVINADALGNMFDFDYDIQDDAEREQVVSEMRKLIKQWQKRTKPVEEN